MFRRMRVFTQLLRNYQNSKSVCIQYFYLEKYHDSISVLKTGTYNLHPYSFRSAYHPIRNL
jgi:hypothetical protein